jgi:hypothetical protein
VNTYNVKHLFGRDLYDPLNTSSDTDSEIANNAKTPDDDDKQAWAKVEGYDEGADVEEMDMTSSDIRLG